MYNRKKNIVKAIRLCLKGFDMRKLDTTEKIRLALKIRDIFDNFEISDLIKVLPDKVIIKKDKVVF